MPVDQSLPKGFLSWLPYLWSNVLFPGQPEIATRVRPWSLFLLILLPAVLLYPTRSFLLLEPDEGRYAQIAREMHDRGEWMVPTLQGRPYLDKPPLLYWLTRISYTIFGISEASARLIPALAVHGSILIVYLIGRRSLGERSAFWGALLLTVAPGFIGMGRLLIIDGLLTFFVALSLFSAFEAIRGRKLAVGWWLLSAVACGLGILTKGPIALLLLAPPLVAYRWLSFSLSPGSAGERVGVRGSGFAGTNEVLLHSNSSPLTPALSPAKPGEREEKPIRVGFGMIALFLGITFLVNLPWYAAIYLREPVFLKHFFWEHNVMRFLKPFDHLQPIWYYLPIILGGLLPGTLLLWSFARYLTAGDDETAGKRSPALGFWLLAGLWCAFFFSLSGCKLPTYILPAFPCLTLALGDFIARSKWNRSHVSKVGVGAMTCVLIFANYRAVPWYAEQRSPAADREMIARYCGDREATVICFPRNCDSVAFYMNRDDLRNVRSKQSQTLVEDLMNRPRTVVLFTHRHSLETLKEVLPPQLKITEVTTLRKHQRTDSIADRLSGDSAQGLCDVAVIERVR